LSPTEDICFSLSLRGDSSISSPPDYIYSASSRRCSEADGFLENDSLLSFIKNSFWDYSAGRPN
jgi:hypothetical protein